MSAALQPLMLIGSIIGGIGKSWFEKKRVEQEFDLEDRNRKRELRRRQESYTGVGDVLGGFDGAIPKSGAEVSDSERIAAMPRLGEAGMLGQQPPPNGLAPSRRTLIGQPDQSGRGAVLGPEEEQRNGFARLRDRKNGPRYIYDRQSGSIQTGYA